MHYTFFRISRLFQNKRQPNTYTQKPKVKLDTRRWWPAHGRLVRDIDKAITRAARPRKVVDINLLLFSKLVGARVSHFLFAVPAGVSYLSRAPNLVPFSIGF